MLSCSNPSCALSSEITRTPQFSFWGYSPFVKPTKFGSGKFNFQRPLVATNVEMIEKVETKEGEEEEEEEEEEKPRFRWVEIGPDISDAHKEAIAQLPPKMTKRCKALMKQIICFSPEKATLSNCLVAWVKIMKPQRADWLSVLKELARLDHPLLFQVAELALLEESFEANVRDFTKIIHGYGKQNRLQDAENTFSAMRKKGLVCDQVTLTTLVNMYSKAGNLKQAEETFEEMKLIGLPLDKKSYGSMIMAYIRAGMPDHGETLLRDMEAQEIYAGREVYKALLRAYSMIGNSEGAQRVFDSIQFAGITPDVKLCGLLINAHVVAGQSNKASIAFDNLRKAGLEPNDKSVALILAAYEKENKLNKALDFLIELERDGIMVGKESSEVLARWFRRLGVVEEVELVLREYASKEAKSKALASNSAPGSNPIIKRSMRPKFMIHSRKTKLPSKRSNERIS